MIYLLDTNPCIRYLNGRSKSLRDRINSLRPEVIVVCSVVKAELHYGAMKSADPEKALAQQFEFLSRFDSLPFDDAAATAYGSIRSDLERAGSPIGANDLMIAAIAVANGVTLVSHNTGEFRRVAGLSIEDWEL